MTDELKMQKASMKCDLYRNRGKVKLIFLREKSYRQLTDDSVLNADIEHRNRETQHDFIANKQEADNNLYNKWLGNVTVEMDSQH